MGILDSLGTFQGPWEIQFTLEYHAPSTTPTVDNVRPKIPNGWWLEKQKHWPFKGKWILLRAPLELFVLRLPSSLRRPSSLFDYPHPDFPITS